MDHLGSVRRHISGRLSSARTGGLPAAVWVAACIGLAPLCRAAADGPMEQLKTGVTEFISILRSDKPAAERRQGCYEVYKRNFDFVRMGRMTLKNDWKGLNDDQKRRFVDKYAQFVFEFYMGKLEKYNTENVEYLGVEEKSDKDKVVVQTRVPFGDGFAAVDYSMSLDNGKWLAYDVEVESIRLTTTYHTQFRDVLNKQGFDGLIAELDKRIEQAKSGGTVDNPAADTK
ncbi:MAG: hypothetical protein A3K19_33645 [Lentisphaerae bacterium RIFOXYB12_FULL_65_16]|nr:MAG: hypothetical protein A3K19_27745 [Lentisphaerae bacterium RIFOXYB12_FULL_65_16]OGV95262.1 MAG: hypothetical protein A3K19_33645 [Lentisphaerae bacterium RIFOXYB12_FULL_65_16]